VDKQGTIAQEATCIYGGGGGTSVWLEGFLGFKPRLVMFNVRLAVKLSVATEDRDVDKLRTIVHTAAQVALFDYPD